MAYARFLTVSWTVLVVAVLAASAGAAYSTNSGPDSPQDRTPSFNPIHQLTLFTLNKFPLSVNTVKACGSNADAETRIYCVLKESVPGLLDQSQGAVAVQVRIGSADLQAISRIPRPLQPVKGASTAERYGFDSDGTAYNAIFLDQGTLYIMAGEPSADVAVGILRQLMDESHVLRVNPECRIRIAANGKALAFKDCQVLDVQKPALAGVEYQKIQCEKPARTGIVRLTSAINGQCPTTVPGTGATRTGDENLQTDADLQFAEKEQLPTVKEYANTFFPANTYQTPVEKCDANNGDENGFFGYRPRTQYAQYGLSKGGCLHFGVDIRGNGPQSGVYGQAVKAMLSGTVVRITPNYQGSGNPTAQTGDKGDYSIVVESGPWRIAYGHLTFKRGVAASQPTFKIGDKIQKDQLIGYPHPLIQTPNYGGELHINVIYTGSDAKLKALTVAGMRSQTKYKTYFDKYDTKTISQKPDFTFGVNNYDQYFLWQAYTTDLKPLSAVDPAAPQPPSAPTATTASDGSAMSHVCVYYYLDGKDGAKDAFFDAGIAAYAGPGGACLVGRAAISRSDIQYPEGYTGYVNVNRLQVAESYEGCYVAKIPLQKHGDQLPTGVDIKLYLSKSQAAFAGSDGYLEKGIARTLADEKTIGKLSCLPPTPVNVRPSQSSEAGNKFLQFAMNLQGAPYRQDLRWSKNGADCSGIITYAFAHMLQAGYRLPPEFYTELNKKEFRTKAGTTVTHPVHGYVAKLNIPSVKIPKDIDVSYPYLSDTWGGLMEAIDKSEKEAGRQGWEIPLDQVQPGDLVLFSYTNGRQCAGPFSEKDPYNHEGRDENGNPINCWRGWGHIEMVHSGSGSQITTFGSNHPASIKKPNEHQKIDKAFRIRWIPPATPDPISNPPAPGTKTVSLNIQHDSTACDGAGGTEFPKGSGFLERIEIIKVALKIRSILEAKGYNVLITKEWKWVPEGDTFKKIPEPISPVTRAVSNRIFTNSDCQGPEFEKHAKFVKDNNAIGVALHFDSYGGTGSTAVYYSKTKATAQSIALAKNIYARLAQVNGISQRKGAVDDTGVGASSGGEGLFFLSELGKIGATGVTVEMSAIDNPRLQSDTERFEKELAEAVAQGILDYAGAGTSRTTPRTNECTPAHFLSPIENPKPRAPDQDGAAYWYGSLDRGKSEDNPDGHHEGVDIAGVEHQTPVRAVTSGTIQDYSAASPCGDGFAGTAVIIKHDCTLGGQPVWTKYCHLSNQNKKAYPAGKHVDKGQIIGYVGKTGNANSPRIAPHLHIEYLKGGSMNAERLLRNGAVDFDPVAAGYLPASLAKPTT